MPPEPRDNPDVVHEHSDINVRAVLWFAGILAAVAVVIYVAVWWQFRTYRDGQARDKASAFPLAAGRDKLPPEPRLEPINRLEGVPDTQFDERLAAREAKLHRYGWVDKEKGIAHIPIEEAMRLLENQLPARANKEGK